MKMLKDIEGFKINEKEISLIFCQESVLKEGWSGYIWLVEDSSISKKYILKTRKRCSVEDLEKESNFGRNLPGDMFFGSIGDNFEKLKLGFPVEPGFLMEFSEEGCLTPYISKISYEVAIKYGIDMLEAVKYLQDRGLVHKDLFSDNVLIHNGTAKIADFGGSIKFVEGEKYEYARGKVYYPPEAQRGELHPYIDTWAVAVILYKMIYKKDIVSIDPVSNQVLRRNSINFFEAIDFYEISELPGFNDLLKDALNFDLKRRTTTKELIEKLKNYNQYCR